MYLFKEKNYEVFPTKLLTLWADYAGNAYDMYVTWWDYQRCEVEIKFTVHLGIIRAKK